MTDARTEWISKRAYMIWEAAGRPHGRDSEHWEQAVREREEFEQVALAGDDKPTNMKKPLIELSKKAQAKSDGETDKPKKKAETAVEKPAAAKAVAKAKAGKTSPGTKQV